MQVALTEAGWSRHRQRQQVLSGALHADLADYDDAALDSAAEVLQRLSAVYDRL